MKNKMETKELKINIPEGFEIDKESSTFECIKFKPIVKRWRDSHSKVAGYFLSGNHIRPLSNDYHEEWNCGNHDVFATEKQAKSALAMAQISQIMANDERFGGVVTDEEWEDTNISKFVITRLRNTMNKVAYATSTYEFLSFHTQEQRDLFLEENEDLVKKYLMIN